MEVKNRELKAIKIIGNQNDGHGRAVFLFLPNTQQRVLNFMRDPKLAHILVNSVVCNFPSLMVDYYVQLGNLLLLITSPILI